MEIKNKSITELTGFDERGIVVGSCHLSLEGTWQCRQVGRGKLSVYCWEESTARHWLRTVLVAKTIEESDGHK